MLSLFRWLFRIATGLVVLFLATTIGVYYFLSRSMPDYDATWRVRGISDTVEIARNTFAVPHIFAETDVDVYYGLGFAHAQDRLWQMMLMRRTAQGRLSEVFGERTLRTDELMRRLDLYGLSQRSVAAQDNDALTALDAYARVCDQILVDAKPPKEAELPGGNGLSFDWRLIGGRRWAVPWMLAGGLTAENVAEAIRLTGASQVDVSSGVESAPGIKDETKIVAFIAAAQGD